MRPGRFPVAISVCTGIMTTLYVGLGAAGYYSKGSGVAEIVIFSLGEGPAARFASGCILVQALSQCERRAGAGGGGEAASHAVSLAGACAAARSDVSPDVLNALQTSHRPDQHQRVVA